MQPANVPARPDSLGLADPFALVSPGRRFLAALATWALYFASMPGLLRPDGFGHFAFVALVPWASVCCRPGRKSFLMEWLAAAIGLAAVASWLRFVLPPILLPLGLISGFYVGLAGWLLRRLARGLPLSVAVPAAWMAGEMARWLIPLPFSFGWMRLGTMAHSDEWLRGSARVFGVWGLTFVFAAFGGWFAELLRVRKGTSRYSLRAIHLTGLLPLALGIGFTIFYPPPAFEDGPRVLLVQPGIEQDRKAFHADPFREVFGVACELTLEGLDELRAAGEPMPDFVAWGETMFHGLTLEPGLDEALLAGAQALPWTGQTIDRAWLAGWRASERACAQGIFFGDPGARPPGFDRLLGELAREGQQWAALVLSGEPLLPAGTSFFCGSEHLGVHPYPGLPAGALRRRNAVVQWNGRGERVGQGGKVHLVPGAETLYGLHHLPLLLDLMLEVGGYIPDLVSQGETAVLELETPARSYAVGATVCFDNAFDDPYTDPMRRGELDFHLVASNEAWYETSVEMDHMVAFSRLIAVMTGRSVVRATNAGVSIVIDPAGVEVAVLEREGRRKMVKGTLAATIPVPVLDREGQARVPLYVRTERLQIGLWWLAIGVLLPLARSRSKRAGNNP